MFRNFRKLASLGLFEIAITHSYVMLTIGWNTFSSTYQSTHRYLKIWLNFHFQKLSVCFRLYLGILKNLSIDEKKSRLVKDFHFDIFLIFIIHVYYQKHASDIQKDFGQCKCR